MGGWVGVCFAFVFCLVSVLVSCSFTCYTMLVILILLRLATYILNIHTCICPTVTVGHIHVCIYNIYLSCHCYLYVQCYGNKNIKKLLFLNGPQSTCRLFWRL